jgi:hypothetical protein
VSETNTKYIYILIRYIILVGTYLYLYNNIDIPLCTLMVLSFVVRIHSTKQTKK